MRLAAILSFLSVFCVPPVDAADVPGVIHSRSAGSPLWVAAQDAFDERGRFRSDRFPDEAGLERRFARPQADRAAQPSELRQTRPDECTEVIGGVIGTGSRPRPDGSLDALVAEALGIYRARVRTVTPGFYVQSPGSLLHTEVVETLRGSPQIDTARGLNVVYNYARFAVADKVFCAGWEEIRPGDEILVFVYYPPADASRSLVSADGRIFLAREDGGVYTPKRRIGGVPATFDELRRVAAEKARRSAARDEVR